MRIPCVYTSRIIPKCLVIMPEKVEKFLGMILDDRIMTMCELSADVGYEVFGYEVAFDLLSIAIAYTPQ